MDKHSQIATRRKKVWLEPDAGTLEGLKSSIAEALSLVDWPLAAEVQSAVPIYDGDDVRAAAPDLSARRDMMAEWATVLADGPGVIVIRDALPDAQVIDRATEIFTRIIEEERAAGAGAGDHFAKPGANDRIWNALEKHCLADPENFAAYFASDAIAMASEAWLGRGYQMTAQVNRVNPGGAAQNAHRDYHLGFMSAQQMTAFPAHIHGISPVLTLQGGIAHCDMPVESGPTMFLPGSQRYFEGYMAFNRLEFQEYFATHHVQMPLAKGDAVFFNPAVMHGAGHNRSTDILRMANLLQVSSAFGRAMESVDRSRMVQALYPALLDGGEKNTFKDNELANIIAATAEGYAFPTNLDLDPPIGGLAPATQAEILTGALAERLPFEDVKVLIRDHDRRRGLER